jgi:hypothetical protein
MIFDVLIPLQTGIKLQSQHSTFKVVLLLTAELLQYSAVHCCTGTEVNRRILSSKALCYEYLRQVFLFVHYSYEIRRHIACTILVKHLPPKFY